MSNHKNLLFFNKEGDGLNVKYNQGTDRFEADLLFHENSTDIYKTIGLYMLENVPSFEYEFPGQLTANKFQIFNEFGIHFYGAKSKQQQISKIEAVNNDPQFYSKWIYGDDFEVKFPIGTIIKFDSTLFEFSDLERCYTVVSSKKNAIMIISQMDNSTFEFSHLLDSLLSSSYPGKTITGVDSIGIYNYIDDAYNNNLSKWNEPDFYDRYYNKRKLNIVNSQSNNTTVTINNIDLTDLVHFEYYLPKADLPVNSEIILEVLTRTDLPKVFQGELNIVSSTKRIEITEVYEYPHILKPGKEFKIVGSSNNTNFLKVASMPEWSGVLTETFFATQSQVLYNNRIYQCVQSYTQSFSSTSTKYLNPSDTNYWTPLPTYIKVEESLVDETLLFGQLYLTTDRFYFSNGWTFSNEVSLATFAEKYATDLKLFNIDLYYKNNALRADLMYPSKYAVCNFYSGQIGEPYSVGKISDVMEKVIGVEETLNYELNYDYSENFKYNVVFTDIDEIGIKIIINKQFYEEEVAYIFTGSVLDMERTIDRTLRNWLKRNYVRLFILGIEAELKYTGSFTSIFYNSIQFKTQYPNVPIMINDVIVGETANYFIEHSSILFTGSGSPSTIGPNLNIRINDKDYNQSTIQIGTSSVSDIPATLKAWVSSYAALLLPFGIIPTNINNILRFDLKRVDRRFEYTVSTSKVNLPGLTDFKITKKFNGNHGALISSNEISLPKTSVDSFEQIGFATGMVVSINNTLYPYNNQEYNIQFLDPQVMNLSYQGPFWSLTQSICNSSAFVNLSFTLGFGQSDCAVPISPIGGSALGEFDPTMFDSSMFNLVYNTNVYSITDYNLSQYPGTTGFVDMLYIQLANSICIFGDNFISVDSYTTQYISTVFFPGNTQSLEMKFNPVNNYVYCLSKQQINVVDPVINTLIANISLTASGNYNAFDIEVNPINGDIYVSFQDWNRINIYSFDNLTSTPTSFLSTSTTNFPPLVTRTGAMVFNSFEGDMYITTQNGASSSSLDYLLRVNTNRTIQTVYGIPGLTHSIFYEPVNESIYVYGSSSLWKVDNGITQSIGSINSTGFADIIFNNLTGEMNISDSSTQFSRLDLNDNTSSQTSVANYGYLSLNQFDGDVYLSSQNFNNIIVIKASTGIAIQSEPMVAQTTKILYNPDRKSTWALQPSTRSLVEMEVEMNNVIEILSTTYSKFDEYQYGTLDPTYKPRPDVWLKSRAYVRKPRENFEGDVPVKYYFRWLSDNVPEMFLYDFSGDQLPTTGPYPYVGVKPLPNAILNKQPNKDKNKLDIPQYQQTIFDKIEWTLSYIDDEDDLTSEVEPLQLFMGFSSQEEGAIRSTMQLYKKEEIQFDISSSESTNIRLETVIIDGIAVAQMSISETSIENFTGRGLKSGQPIVIYVKDITNSTNQYTSPNHALLLKIRNVYTKILICDFYNNNVDFLETEDTIVRNYPISGQNTYLRLTIKVKDREIGRFAVYGQTEVEDIRYKIELGNVGKLINPDEVFIFKEYDILEGGIDYTFLNKKRKEMLMNKHLIYPYIGAYKSIINAINYFGYNDLQLNEYFRNIDPESKNFLKLFKVEIPDIFDNTVIGWNERPYSKIDLSSDKFEGTKSFNLTYNITDRQGNIILDYSIDEIIIKLQGLKFWLKKNIIPLTHKILDITGNAHFTGGSQIQHKLCDIRIINMKQEMCPITFRLNEAYLMPVNSGSTVYNCVVDFYSIIPGMGASYSLIPTDLPPAPSPSAKLEMPEYFNLSVRTYKTYKEWAPYVNYTKGDKVLYYDRIYESQIVNNKAKNPKKYESTANWNSTYTYQTTNVVKYSRDFYVFSGLGSTQSLQSPNLDELNWLKITEWRVIDKEPVQIINEWRKGNNLLPFNFTIDSNIDPYLVIEVTTDNGYGGVYRQKKNYEIRGTKDLQEPYKGIDPIGPFESIPPVY